MTKKIVKRGGKQVRGFINFIREQGIAGLAIGFILGGAVSNVVKSLVVDIIEPTLGIFIGSTDGLKSLAFRSITYGQFLTTLIDLLIIAAVIYFGFRKLGAPKLDKSKQ